MKPFFAILSIILLASCSDMAVMPDQIDDSIKEIETSTIAEFDIAINAIYSGPEPSVLSKAFLAKAGMLLANVKKSDGTIDYSKIDVAEYNKLVGMADKLAHYEGNMANAYKIVRAAYNDRIGIKLPTLEYPGHGTEEEDPCIRACLNSYYDSMSLSADVLGTALITCVGVGAASALISFGAGAGVGIGCVGMAMLSYYVATAGHGDALASCTRACLENDGE